MCSKPWTKRIDSVLPIISSKCYGFENIFLNLALSKDLYVTQAQMLEWGEAE